MQVLVDSGQVGTDLGGGSGAPRAFGTKTFTLTWSFTESTPTGKLLGFECVFYTGTDPNNTANYLTPPIKVLLTDRSLVRQLALPTSFAGTVQGAVRAVYPGGFTSAWAATGSGTPSAVAAVETSLVSLANTTNASVNARLLTNPNLDNLIPNPTSELGVLSSWEGVLVVNDPTNSYAGNYCRKLSTAATNLTALTPFLPALYGDQFTFEAYAKVSSASAAVQLVLTFYDASGTSVGTATSTAVASTTYGKVSVQGTAPAGTATVVASVQTSTVLASNFGYFDQLSLRRSVQASQLFGDGGFRVINALANTGTTTADRTYYRGNNDPGTRGGAPNIGSAGFTIFVAQWDTTNKIAQLDFNLQPQAASDNFDGMRYAKVVLYRQSAAGTTGTLTSIGTYYVPLIDRLYKSTTDTNSGNLALATWCAPVAGVTSGVAAAIVTLYNAFGPSDTHCFYTASGGPTGVNLVDNGTSFPAGLTGGGSGGSGGGGGGGGSCPDPAMPIDVMTVTRTIVEAEDGTLAAREVRTLATKRAGDLVVGDLVWTVDPATGTVGAWPVVAASTEPGPVRYAVTVDGVTDPIIVAAHHRWRVAGRGWVEVEDLAAGDVLEGTAGGRAVVAVATADPGDVVRLTVDAVHTFQIAGTLHSNLKPIN